MRFLLVSLYLLLLKPTSFAQHAAAIARQYSDAVVMIVVQDAQRQSLALGSGLVVEPGKVLTNKHVIEGAKFAYALSSAGKKYPVTGIHALDAKNDLALLSIPGLQASAVKISLDSVEVGQRIYAIGNPEGLSNSISEGIVSGRRNILGCALYQITAPISPGSSGGPIVNDDGEVVGIAVGALTSGQNLNFAIPIRLLGGMRQASPMQPLNIPIKRVENVGGETMNLTEGIQVVDVVKQELSYSSDCLPNGGHRVEGIAIRNKMSSPIASVKLLLVLYNSSNEPIDSKEIVLCSTESYSERQYGSCDIIPPGLAKHFNLRGLRGTRVICIAEGEKLKLRVLGCQFAD